MGEIIVFDNPIIPLNRSKEKTDKENIPVVSHECVYQLIRADEEDGGSGTCTQHHLKHIKRPDCGKKALIKIGDLFMIDPQ